ncbi:MAG: hypothetical protein LIP12_17800 [Clostridiales bacterium]|nr:hypothetical protein [Clostridiales bacterium]
MYEVIDLLCSIVEQQATLIRKMVVALLQTDLPEELKGEIASQKNKMERDIESAHFKLRH